MPRPYLRSTKSSCSFPRSTKLSLPCAAPLRSLTRCLPPLRTLAPLACTHPSSAPLPQDGNGTIEHSELKLALHRLDPDMTDDDVAALFHVRQCPIAAATATSLSHSLPIVLHATCPRSGGGLARHPPLNLQGVLAQRGDGLHPAGTCCAAGRQLRAYAVLLTLPAVRPRLPSRRKCPTAGALWRRRRALKHRTAWWSAAHP